MFLINLLGEIGGAKTLKNKNNEVITWLKTKGKPFKNLFLPKINFLLWE